MLPRTKKSKVSKVSRGCISGGVAWVNAQSDAVKRSQKHQGQSMSAVSRSHFAVTEATPPVINFFTHVTDIRMASAFPQGVPPTFPVTHKSPYRHIRISPHKTSAQRVCFIKKRYALSDLRLNFFFTPSQLLHFRGHR